MSPRGHCSTPNVAIGRQIHAVELMEDEDVKAGEVLSRYAGKKWRQPGFGMKEISLS